MSRLRDLEQRIAHLEALVAQQAEIIDSLRAENATLRSENAALRADNERLRAENEHLRAEVSDLAETNRGLLHWRFGRRTEKSSELENLQALIALEGWGSDLFSPSLGTLFPVDTASEVSDEHVPASGGLSTPAGKRAFNRQLWSRLCPHLRVDEVLIELSPDERFDSDGTPLVRQGVETREELVYEPGLPFIRRVVRQRYGRSDTGEKIATAANPDRIVPRGCLADETILNAVVNLAGDCLPFYRQAEMFDRLSIPVTRQTLCASFHAWCQLASPLVDIIHQQILQAPVIHIDGSFIYRQNQDGSRRCTRFPIYAITDGEQVVLRWRANERHETAADLARGYRGYLIRDEWEGWWKLDDVDAIHVGCNAHARRYFAQHQDDGDAAHMVALYARLFAIERHAADSGLTDEALFAHRLTLRHHHSVAIMDAIENLARDIISRRTGTIVTAANYILIHRRELRRFLENGALPPTNNLAERVLRRNAIVRRNRPFYVAEDGGIHLAHALSICGSCRQLGINPLAYLKHCLPALLAHRAAEKHGRPLPDLHPWTPAVYARSLTACAAA